jgi:hypothetical protein
MIEWWTPPTSAGPPTAAFGALPQMLSRGGTRTEVLEDTESFLRKYLQ